MDHLGRPLLYQSSWREGRGSVRASADMDGGWDEQRRRRVESYLRSSHMSLVRVAQGGLGGLIHDTNAIRISSFYQKLGSPIVD